MQATALVGQIQPQPTGSQGMVGQSGCAHTGIRPKQAVASEDALNGLLAAKGAGLFCVVVPNQLTHQLPLDDADLRLTSLTDMPLEILLERIQERARKHV